MHLAFKICIKLQLPWNESLIFYKYKSLTSFTWLIFKLQYESGIYCKLVLTVKQTHRLTDDQICESVGSKSHRTRKVNVSVSQSVRNTDSQTHRNPA